MLQYIYIQLKTKDDRPETKDQAVLIRSELITKWKTSQKQTKEQWQKYNAGVALWHVKNRNRLSTEGVTKDTSIVDYNLVVAYSDALLVFGVDTVLG